MQFFEKLINKITLVKDTYWENTPSNVTKYSRMDPVKFVEDSL